MIKNFEKIFGLITNILVFCIGFLVFYFSAHLPDCNDLCYHNKTIQLFNLGHSPINGHFVYFLTVSFFTLFSTNYEIISITSSVILSLCLLLKKWLTEKLIIDLIKLADVKISSIIKIGIFVISTLLIFHSNMPVKPPYKLPWPPITWINSTTIFVFPFCIYLFQLSFKFIENPLSKKELLKLIFLSIFVLFSKPNYIIVFIISFPLMMFFYQRKFFIKSLYVITFLMFLMLIQYLYIYYFLVNKANLFNYQHVKIVIEPFNAWKKISSNLFGSFLLWFALPIFISIIYFKKLFTEKIYIYALIQFILGLIIFIMFEEKNINNRPLGSVNFIWQVFITLYIWTVICVTFSLKYFIQEPNNKMIKIKSIAILTLILYYFVSTFILFYNTIFSKINYP